MSPSQAIELSIAAKAKGYALAVNFGRVQFQTVEYDARGVSTITPRTGWLDYDEALLIIKGE